MNPSQKNASSTQRSGQDSIALIDTTLLQNVIAAAQGSPRKRSNYNLHISAEDNPHRFINVFTPGTYVRPHRHAYVPKAETFLVLQGSIGFLIFDDHGRVSEKFILDSQARFQGIGIDILPGPWHSLVALSEKAVCFEIKPGPYNPETDKEFAAWAPEENTDMAAEYAAKLMREFSHFHAVKQSV